MGDCSSTSHCNPCGPDFNAINQLAVMSAAYARNAQTYSVNAANAANAAEESLEEFKSIYIGAFPSDPAGPQETGAIYFNTVSYQFFVWDGTSWVAAPSGFNEFTTFLATGTTTPRNLVTRMADVVNVKDFGAVGDGVAFDQDEIQAAINYAGTQLNANLAYPLVKSAVYFPAGTYRIQSGSSITIPRGVRIYGESRSSVTIKHEGGGVPCFTVNLLASSNTNISIENIEVLGTSGTTYGIQLAGNVRNGALKSVTVRECEINVGGTECYTMQFELCDFQKATQRNVDFENLTAATFISCRIDEAAVDNIRLRRSALNPSTATVFINCYIQRAKKNGVLLEDVDNAQFYGVYFEGNNQDSNSDADIAWTHGPYARGSALTVVGGFGTATSGGTNSRFIKATTAGEVLISNVFTFIGTAPGQYAVAVDLGASITKCVVNGCRFGATNRIVAASTNTMVLDQTEGVFNYANETVNPLFKSNGNFSPTFDSPSNRRMELIFQSGGVNRWFVGRGDGDEPFPDDFYVGRTSGGGNPPDLRIDNSGITTINRLTLSGPFADDVAAAAGGIGLNQCYLKTGGNVAWRVI